MSNSYPSGWLIGKLGDFITLKRGYDLPAYERKLGLVPVITSSGFSDTHSEAMVSGPGVVIGRYGTIGEVFYVEEDFWPHNTTLYVEDFKGNDPHFVAYFLKTLNYDAHNDKTSVPGLNRNHLHTIDTAFPHPIEQRAIAHILGTLDDKIELNRQMNATLEEITRTIFQSWFVDFDPVRAKMRGEQPYGMDAETAALFPDSLVESELGEIPAGWKVGRIGEYFRVVGGSTPSTKEPSYWDDGDINWATPKDLAELSSPVLLETSRKITKAGLAQISSGLLPKGTVLMSSRAPVGYLAISEIPIAINQGFIAMVCDNQLSNYYGLWWCKSNMPTIENQANGTTFQEISKSNFRPIPALAPEHMVMDLFNSTIEPIYKRIVSNLEEIGSLIQIRDTLLPKLISGQIRVNDLQGIIS